MTTQKAVGTVQEVRFKDRLEHQQHRRLNDPVLDRGNSQWSLPAIRLGSGLLLQANRGLALLRWLTALFRSGMIIQADLLTSDENMSQFLLTGEINDFTDAPKRTHGKLRKL